MERKRKGAGRAMSHDAACRVLAQHFLRAYRLSASERTEETERLAEIVQQCVETELESLAHRYSEGGKAPSA